MGEKTKPVGASYYCARYYDPTQGRFLDEDPLRFGGGKNFYLYAHNEPTSVTDSSGMNATVSVGPNGIVINVAITIYGPGVTPELAMAWQKAIIKTWNNNPGYGNCNVTFNVQVTPDLSANHWFTAASNPDFAMLAQNYMYVPAGIANAGIDPLTFTGTIPSQTLLETVPHEFGHILGLLDMNWGGSLTFGDPTDIMFEGGNVVSAADITAAVNRAYPNSLKDMISSCTCH